MTTVTSPLFLDFRTRTEASEAAANFAARALSHAVQTRGSASLAVSGGSTPGPMFQHLSETKLDWSAVTVGLVDERFVDATHDASNERLVRQTLLINAASDAIFLPMSDTSVAHGEAAAKADAAYAPLSPFDFVLLGMGNDGHTASWFPSAKGLEQMLEPSRHTVGAVDAAGCLVAGAVTDRLTLTYSAVTSAHHAVLLIFGDEKRDVFERALTASILEAPIRAAVHGLGQKLTIVWAP